MNTAPTTSVYFHQWFGCNWLCYEGSQLHWDMRCIVMYHYVVHNAFQILHNYCITRTTRTPAFWGYPPPPHDYPYHWVIFDPKSNVWILKWALHATHLLKLLDKMCKYEMDPMSILEDTERARFCPQTDRQTDGRMDRRTDGQTDKVIPVYPPINFVEAGGIIIRNWSR